ncbi:uncharacterized protein RHOBADRAFT_51117 [Rhodotorula graminis WP1]|uniref:HPP transmembrane region domain-containing protein n=1 Tax=Rhodotorula graminis (strain WP1) TaxID=578459 RepID=A0A194SDX1_RHOGW|nr:uncharacterized protein RHOBADRAFT_51117 [Rhodotorula graminis WP1]KPV78680.1 hypothetical protein RHOBADRAFT_51117 [Rhodotorula graminis WP1]
MHNGANVPAVAAPPLAPPTFPPAVEPARHSRLAESLSPPRTTSQRRWSHSRGRPRALGGSSVERSMSRGTADSSGAARAGTGWSERSDSRDGSRAPMLRGAGPPQTGENREAGGPAREVTDEKVRLEDGDEQAVKGVWAVRLARHFVGIRDKRSFPAPLVRPLRHLSPQTEGYILGFLGSFPSILIACAISLGLSTLDSSAFSTTPLTVGSFGATAVLLYAVPEAPLSQPRNVIGGHLVSAVTGAVISQLFSLSSRFDSGEFVVDNTLAARGSWGSLTPVSASLAVALATLAMQVTGTVHPPGGATALIVSYYRTTSYRWTYVLDVVLSVTAMTVWATFVGNLGRRRYPTFWWTPNPPPPAPSAPAAAHGAPAPSSTPSKQEKRPPSPPTHHEHAPSLSPNEDLERRWLGRLGEVDEEALGEGDEPARREEERWLEEEAEAEERGRRATRR